MTDPNYTNITIVLDSSGSMKPSQGATLEGLNSFIDKQRDNPGRTTVTLVTFSDRYQHQFVDRPVHEVPRLNSESYDPMGTTALLDALGSSIEQLGTRLRGLSEAARPGKVVFVVLTDGEENASHLFTHEQIKQMIAHQQATYSWQFVYLGANQDAFSVGSRLGLLRGSTTNFKMSNLSKAFDAVATNVSLYAMTGDQGSLSYSAEQMRALNA